MTLINNIREKLKGLKTYILIGFAAVTVTAQFLTGFDLGVPSLPPAETLGEFIEQVYQFLIVGTLRAAIK